MLNDPTRGKQGIGLTMVDATTGGRRRPRLFTHAVQRHWIAIVLVTLVVTALAGAFALTRSRSYTASSTVFIRPLNGNSFSSSSFSSTQNATVALQTEARLVDSVPVTDRVNAALHTHLKPGASVVSASVPTDTQLVLITATGNSAVQARRYADAYATAYLAYRSSLAQSSQKAQLAKLNVQAAAAQRDLESAAIATHRAHPAPNAAAELELATARLSAIQSAIGQAQSIETNPGAVVKAAHSTPASLLSGRAVVIVGGAILGLLLGLGVAVWRELRDDRIHAAGETSIEGVPLLARMHPVPKGDGAGPAMGLAEIRRARSSLLAVLPERAVLAISPVSAADASATAHIAVRLARSLAAAGYRTTLVDASIVEPQIARLVGARAEAGLSELLKSEPADAQPVDHDGVGVLTAGSHAREQRERYGGERLATVLAALQSDADLVLVVTDPLDTSDGAAVLRGIGNVALVASDEQTTRRALSQASAIARQLGCAVVGALIARPARSGSKRQRAAEATHSTREPRKPASATAAADHDKGFGSGVTEGHHPSPDGTDSPGEVVAPEQRPTGAGRRP